MGVYFFTADRMPMGMASVQVKIIVETPSTTVIASRSFTSSLTGRRHSIESPKSHWTMPQTHLKYCTYRGWSRPYCERSASTSLSSASSPVA